MDSKQLRELITEVLVELDLYSADACELLLLTAAQESHLGHYIQQVGSGPAKGIFQCEPNTEKDIWDNYLKYKPALRIRVGCLMGEADFNNLQLKGNILYQIAMARIHYLRVPTKLPSRMDIPGMAAYWKKYYNTHLGKGTVEEAEHNYRRLVDGES